eukprot:GILJ01004283.1.p1 GENE.GILJ01004283.1~~GILJ01004283.1.p1  ORF type:complete len:161 (-),score=12.08 GILJ01004283.1:340-822(-)
MDDINAKASARVLTFGHSDHPMTTFIDLLHRYDVATVVDIRSVPASGRYPHFAKKALQESIQENGLEYIWLGTTVGGKLDADESGAYWVSREGVDAISRMIDKFQTAWQDEPDDVFCLLCSEASWRECHRKWLADQLVLRGIEVQHISHDGTLENHDPRN